MSDGPKPYDRAPFYAFEPKAAPNPRYVLCPNGCGDYLIPPRELGQLGAMPVYQCDLCNERGQEPNVWTDGQLRLEATSQALLGFRASLCKGAHKPAFEDKGRGFGDLSTANHKRESREIDDRGVQIGPRGCFTRSAGVLSARRAFKFSPELASMVRQISTGSKVSINQVVSLALLRAARTSSA